MQFLKFQKEALPDLLHAHFEAAAGADANRPVEERAATMIQAAYRGHVERSRRCRMASSARVMQRVARAFLSRRRVLARAAERGAAERRALYDDAATRVQRVWRGHFSRRVRHDFYARKRYIEGIEAGAASFRRELSEEAARMEGEHFEREEEDARAEFRDITRNLHHLLSTRAQPGIYNPPHAPPVEAYGEPVESHLRRVKPSPRGRKKQASEETLPRVQSARLPAKSGLATSVARASVRGPFLPPARLERKVARLADPKRQTVRTSEPYEDPIARQRREDKEKRMAVREKVPFRTTLREPVIGAAAPTSVHVNTPYQDPHPKPDRAPAGKPPFCASVGRGKGFGDDEAL